MRPASARLPSRPLPSSRHSADARPHSARAAAVADGGRGGHQPIIPTLPNKASSVATGHRHRRVPQLDSSTADIVALLSKLRTKRIASQGMSAAIAAAAAVYDIPDQAVLTQRLTAARGIADNRTVEERAKMLVARDLNAVTPKQPCSPAVSVLSPREAWEVSSDSKRFSAELRAAGMQILSDEHDVGEEIEGPKRLYSTSRELEKHLEALKVILGGHVSGALNADAAGHAARLALIQPTSPRLHNPSLLDQLLRERQEREAVNHLVCKDTAFTDAKGPPASMSAMQQSSPRSHRMVPSRQLAAYPALDLCSDQTTALYGTRPPVQ